MNIEIDIKKWKKTKLSLSEYLLLAFLVNDNSQELNHLELEILDHLEELGYLRMIDDTPVIDAKARNLFSGDLDIKANKVLDYFNELKSKYSLSNRKSLYSTYGSEIKARIVENNDSIEDIKVMLDYMFNEWVKVEPEMKGYLRPQTLFNRKKYPNYMDKAEMNKSKSMDSVFERVEDD